MNRFRTGSIFRGPSPPVRLRACQPTFRVRVAVRRVAGVQLIRAIDPANVGIGAVRVANRVHEVARTAEDDGDTEALEA